MPSPIDHRDVTLISAGPEDSPGQSATVEVHFDALRNVPRASARFRIVELDGHHETTVHEIRVADDSGAHIASIAWIRRVLPVSSYTVIRDSRFPSSTTAPVDPPRGATSDRWAPAAPFELELFGWSENDYVVDLGGGPQWAIQVTDRKGAVVFDAALRCALR